MSDLLPPNATTQERALSNAIERAASVPVPIKTIWNPDTCPANLLPWLAWAFSVDAWNSSWTETQQRQAIKSSISVHKRKGTAGAVKDAIKAAGYDVDFIEWFDRSPKGAPYTFAVQIDVLTSPDKFNEESATEITRIANETKNVRSKILGVEWLASVSGAVYVGAVSLDRCNTTIYPYFPNMITVNPG